MPAGNPGECDGCGEWSGRLVDGYCCPCRDKYKAFIHNIARGSEVMQKLIRLVATNDRGMRIGEFHQNAHLSDKEVDQIRDLHEFAAWSYRDIARAYGASKSCIAEICRYEKRNQTVFDWKQVKIIPGPREEVEA